ncbi:uncharacterized protein LOC141701695 [Apium graveolens]|uniref:2'-phosphotransferase n=2 Tax=Apium graveolens TaxID=4045 RepID=A0A6L5BAG7_APIGR|nr:hypothetical protein AG4045_021522 [Apium graveolens]
MWQAAVFSLPSYTASRLYLRSSFSLSKYFQTLNFPMDNNNNRTQASSSCSNSTSGGGNRGRSSYTRGSSWGRGGGSRGRGGGSRGYSGGGAFTPDKIDSLGRLMTWILRHTASKFNLDIRSDGYVKVQDLLKLNLQTVANIPLNSHTIADVRKAVIADNKQRFSLVEENGELFVRANQGHTLKAVKTESLLKPIISAEEVPVCVHGTYRENLPSILEHGLKCMKRLHIHFACGLPKDSDVISGMRENVNILIFLDVKKALEEGMELYFSENKVVLTEGFNGVIPVKYFERIESRPGRQLLYVGKDEDLVTGMQKLAIKTGAKLERPPCNKMNDVYQDQEL